jgi:hypothetical protein
VKHLGEQIDVSANGHSLEEAPSLDGAPCSDRHFSKTRGRSGSYFRKIENHTMEVCMLLEESEDQRSVSAADVDDRLHVLPRKISEFGEPTLCAGLHCAIERIAHLPMLCQPAPPIGSGTPLEHVLAGSRRRQSFSEGAVDLAVDHREVTPTGSGVAAEQQ